MATQADIDRFDALMTAGNYGAAAALASSLGVDPGVVANYVNERFGDQFGGTTVTPEVVQQAAATYTPPPPPPPAVDPVAQQYVDNFNTLINQGNYEDAARLVKEADLAGYGENAYRAAAVALEANTNLPPELNFLNAEGIQSIKDYVNTVVTPTPAATPAATPTEVPASGGIASIPTGPQTTPGAGQLYGMPTYTRQEYSPLRFAPLRRASGFTPEQLQSAVGGRSVEDIAYLMDTGRVSPAELSSALNLPVGQIQAQYNQIRPGGLFSTPGQDFVLQTGAYGAPTPTFFTPNYPTPASKTPENTTTSPGTTQDETTAREGGMIKMAEGGNPPPMAKLSPAEAGSKFDISEFVDEQGRLVGGYSRPIRDEFGVITSYDYQPYQRDVVFNPRLAEAEAEARRTMTDEDRAVMMRDLAIRQGRTGVDPYTGAGLPGIVAAAAYDRPRYYNYQFAKGGDVSSTAQDLASRGRGGDTMLVHMAPHEVAGLNALARSQGTELTINPETGMPEALKLGKLFKTLAPFIPFIPGVGQFMAPFLPSGLATWGAANPLLAKAVASGVIGGFTGPKGGFDLQRGLMQGITAYGMSNLMQNLGPATATPGGTPGGPPAVAPEFGGIDLGSASSAANAELAQMGGSSAGFGGQAPFTDATSIDLAGAQTPRVNYAGFNADKLAYPTAEPINIGADGEFMLPGEGEVPTPKQSFDMRPVSQRPLPYGQAGVPGLDPNVAAPPTTGLSTSQALLTTGLGATSLMDYDKSLAARMALEDEEKKNKRIYRDLFARTLGRVPTRTMTGRAGGLMKLAGGGMTYMEAGGTTGPTGAPRDVVGTGDGMSDSVPADIEGVQEARLADGEFVIPADVVSDIGNGSSDAGSKKLYAMMDRIREARHGTTEQPPEINAERMMPA